MTNHICLLLHFYTDFKHIASSCGSFKIGMRAPCPVCTPDSTEQSERLHEILPKMMLNSSWEKQASCVVYTEWW